MRFDLSAEALGRGGVKGTIIGQAVPQIEHSTVSGELHILTAWS